MKLLVILTLVFCLVAAGCSPATRTETGTTPAILDRVVLRSDDGATEVILAVDHTAYGRLFDAIMNEDREAADQLVTDGTAFRVPTGTLALYLEAESDGVRVQVLEGDRRNESGWIPFSWMYTVK
jgi:hypothetical protein